MSYRYQKRIKICKGLHLNVSKSGIGISLGIRGASISMGPRGTYTNIGIPGTGLSHREKISDNTSFNDNSYKPEYIPEQEAQPGSKLVFKIDNDGKEYTFLEDPNGRPFTNDTVLRRATKSEEYKELVETTRRIKYKEMKENNDSCVLIYKQTPQLITKEEVINEKNDTSEIKQKFYRPKRFELPHPDESKLYDEAYTWAIENTKNVNVFNRKKKINEATKEKLEELFNASKQEWINKKNDFLEQERKIKELKDREFEKEYQNDIANRDKIYETILNPDDNYIDETIGYVLSQINLPVDFSIDYSVTNKEIELDIDLPEIEDFPQNTCSILSSGKLSIKNKTVSDLNKDYATSVTGMAFFFAGTLFNISPKIEVIKIKGYTQRISKKTGNIEDQYVYSINFTRNIFSSLNISNIEPLEAISNFENKIDITSKFELKTIAVKEPQKTEVTKEIEDESSSTDMINNETTENSNVDFCYSPQSVDNDYDENFECTYLQKKSSVYINKEKRMKTLRIIIAIFILLFIVLFCYHSLNNDSLTSKSDSEKIMTTTEIQQSEDEQLKQKEAEEKEAGIKTVKTKYMMVGSARHLETTLKNPKLGIKGGGKSEYVNVKCIYAYCQNKTDSYQMIQDIIAAEDTNRLFIYLYDERFTQTELKKGQVEDNPDYSYVKDHLIDKWFYD